MTKDQSSPTTGRRRPRRLARWGRWLAVVALLFVIGAGAGWWYVTSSSFIIARIEPTLERLLGGDVRIGEASYVGDGLFVLDDIVLRVRGRGGPAGQVCRIESARVVVEMDRLLDGEVQVRFIELSDVLLRISEDTHDAGVFNFMALAPDWSSDARAERLLPPRVRMNRTVLEVGVHDGERYRPRGRRALSGSMQPVPDEDGWYRLTLVEVDEHGEVVVDEGILIDGRWNVETNQHVVRLAAVELSPRTYVMCPQIARLWWDRMELAGRVSGVEMDWSAQSGMAVRFLVEDVGLTLPIETAGLWARYRDGGIESSASRPRMHVRSGAIRVTESQVSLDDLEGQLLSADTDQDVVGVPYRVSVTIDEIPELDWEHRQQWMDDVLATSPFTMLFRTDDFRIRRQEGQPAAAVELPLAVARVLEKFHFGDWVLSTGIDVTRGAPQVGDDGARKAAEIRSRGRAYITKATGTYQRFPYPLENIDAYLEFDNDQVDVHYLTGAGSDGATVRLAGKIAPPTRDGMVELRLTATGVPLDERMRDALNEGQQRVFDSLLDRSAYDALDEAGLLVDEEAIERLGVSIAEREQTAASDRIRLESMSPERPPERSGDDAADLAQLEATLERDRNILASGPFRLGGTVDLDLQIVRPFGPDQPTLTTGRISLQNIGVVFEHFPYPISVLGGAIEWREDEIVAVSPDGTEGLPVVTAGGGRGRLRGRIDFVRGGRVREDGRVALTLRPDINVSIRGDVPNPTLYAAIPPAAVERVNGAVPEGWPGRTLSRGAQWLKDLAIAGAIDYTAQIGAEDEGGLAYHVDLDLRDGQAFPGPALAAALGRDTPIDPRGWRLESCAARVTLDRDVIALERFEGLIGPGGERGRLEVSGQLDLGPEGGELALRVQGASMPVGDHLLDLLPESHAEVGGVFWERYRPSGVFDVDLEYRRRGEAVERSLRMMPREVQARIGDRVVDLVRVDGALRSDGEVIRIEDVVVRARSGDQDDGLLVLRGVVPLATDAGDLRLDGQWTAGNLESPLVEEALRISSAETLVEEYRRFAPEGRFDAVFEYDAPADGGEASFALAMKPKTLTFRVRDTPIYLELESDAEITVAPGRIDFARLACRHAGGTVEFSGALRTSPRWEADLALAYTGRLMSSQLSAFLPEGVERVLQSLDFQEGGPSALSNGRLVLARSSPADGVPAWDVAFTGRVAVQDASFRAGLEYRDVSGPFDVTVERSGGRPPSIEIVANPTRLEILGQTLRNTTAVITTSADGGRVLVRDLRADVGDGAMTGEATIGLGDDETYHVSSRLVGVPLDGFRLKPPATADATSEDPATIPIPTPTPTPAPTPGPRPTGQVYASLDLGGRRGDPASRYGRGVARVIGGRLVSVPLALQIVNLLQLTLSSDVLDFADVEFFVDGRTLVLEEMFFESTRGKAAMIRLMGTGEMDLETFEVSSRFRSRSSLPIISDIVGEIGDRFIAIEVTGPLSSPRARIIALPDVNRSPRTFVGVAPTTPAPEP